MLRCSVKLLLTNFIILVAGFQHQQPSVQAALHTSSECLENKLDLVLEKLKVYNGDQCDHRQELRSAESHHYRCRDASSTENNTNRKCSERLAQICQNRGISEIQVDSGVPPYTVLCDADRWMVILQRMDESVVFHNRTWDSYKMGFGSISEMSEFFLGLQYLHELTLNDYFELRIDLEDFAGVEK